MDADKIKLRYMAAYLFVQGIVILGVLAVALSLPVPLMLGLAVAVGAVQVLICFYLGKSGIYPGGW